MAAQAAIYDFLATPCRSKKDVDGRLRGHDG
jgi:hypothetical protein